MPDGHDESNPHDLPRGDASLWLRQRGALRALDVRAPGVAG
jgi:hypothetical protein